MKTKNKFITFEGIDGSGKTTFIKKLKESLIKSGFDVLVTREPGGNDVSISEEIRSIVLKNKGINPLTELLLFEASRREHLLNFVKPNLDKGKIIICDRFADSTFVYQNLRGNDKKTIKIINKIVVENIKPSVTFLLDVDPKISLERKNIRQKNQNKFDLQDLDFFTKARDLYLDLYKKNKKRIFLIDSSKSEDEVLNNILKVISDLK